MRVRFQSYAAYSITCFVVWGLIFAVGLIFHLKRDNHPVIYIFFGWVIGWLSATIARKVYK